VTVRKVFYVTAGGADLIGSHEHWSRGENNPAEVSLTFSGQIQSFVRAAGAEAYMISARPEPRIVRDGAFTFEDRPRRPRHGWRYHMEELRFARSLVETARAFGADVALLDSGSTHYFLMDLFRRAGIPVVPILHNTLWPHGYPPRGTAKKAVAALDYRFLRRGPKAVLAVSPEAERQLDSVAPNHSYPVHQIRAQFDPGYFATISPPNDPASGPFNVMFIGRVTESKGVLDIPVMARWIEDREPGRVRWTICGRGDALEPLRASITDKGLDGVVEARGWTSLEDLRDVYARSHASIVPTRSGFAEGLAMTAAEAVLAGRPVVTNPVVPAHELLSPACVLGRTNDPVSHAEAILALANDPDRYRTMQRACSVLGAPFLDRSQGLAAILWRTLCDGLPPASLLRL